MGVLLSVVLSWARWVAEELTGGELIFQLAVHSHGRCNKDLSRIVQITVANQLLPVLLMQAIGDAKCYVTLTSLLAAFTFTAPTGSNRHNGKRAGKSNLTSDVRHGKLLYKSSINSRLNEQARVKARDKLGLLVLVGQQK